MQTPSTGGWAPSHSSAPSAQGCKSKARQEMAIRRASLNTTSTTTPAKRPRCAIAGWLGFVSGERQVCRTRRPGPAPVQTDNAKAFLLHVLKDRPELPFVVRRMAKDEGISAWALEQPKRGLGLVQVIAKDGRMHWALP